MNPETTAALVSGPAQRESERKAIVLERAAWIKGRYRPQAEFKWCFGGEAERDGH